MRVRLVVGGGAGGQGVCGQGAGGLRVGLRLLAGGAENAVRGASDRWLRLRAAEGAAAMGAADEAEAMREGAATSATFLSTLSFAQLAYSLEYNSGFLWVNYWAMYVLAAVDSPSPTLPRSAAAWRST